MKHIWIDNHHTLQAGEPGATSTFTLPGIYDGLVGMQRSLRRVATPTFSQCASGRLARWTDKSADSGALNDAFPSTADRRGLCMNLINPQANAHAFDYLVTYPEAVRRAGENKRLTVLGRYGWTTEEAKRLRFYKERMA